LVSRYVRYEMKAVADHRSRGSTIVPMYEVPLFPKDRNRILSFLALWWVTAHWGLMSSARRHFGYAPRVRGAGVNAKSKFVTDTTITY
jgi:hypothetical protein